MSYTEYTFTVSPPEPGSDILIALIADLGFESFVTTETGFIAYISDDNDPAAELSGLHFEDFEFFYTTNKIVQVNWNEEWEKNFQPVTVSDDCIIRAPFHQTEKPYTYDIVIMPKMSFGTGHHDTTWLVCRNMLGLDLHGKTVLDMGCGTAVLAILARKLGAKDITGIDIDDWSVENALENCVANNCGDIRILKGNSSLLTEPKRYDLILANINKNVLKADMAVYASSLKNDGTLFLSGFFKTDCEELINLASKHCLTLSKQETRNDWAVLVLRKTA